MSDSRMLSVKPIIHYPRVAQVGKTYLMTIDLEVEEGAEWQYEEEEYPIYCTVDSELFSSKPVGEPVVLLHRFGGSYGEAKFLLTAAQIEQEGRFEVTLINRWGVLIQTLRLSSVLSGKQVISSSMNQFQVFPLLQAGEQHLSMRPQIRQTLVEEREIFFNTYLRDLESILNNSDVRFHIKQAVFTWLGSLADPKEEEWDVIKPLMHNESSYLRQQVWYVLRASRQWFQLVDSLGVVEEQWLQSERQEDIDQAVNLLSIMQRQLPDRVAELVEPYVGTSEDWDRRLSHVLQGSDLSTGRTFFNLFLRSISAGVFDPIKNVTGYNRDFWMQIYSLPEKQPEWACEAIGVYLNRQLELSLTIGQTNPFDHKNGTLSHSQFEERVLHRSADKAADVFVQHVLPFMLRVMELTSQPEGDLPWNDVVWRYRAYGAGYDLKDRLLTQMEVALSNLAQDNPEAFTSIKAQYLHDSKFETIQFLLIRAYTANGERFANEAIDYLCEDPIRLKTGYSIVAGNSRAAVHWATRKLIEATTPYCSIRQLERLENLLLEYYPNWERGEEFRLLRGYSQFVLLDGITTSRISPSANRRLQEWRRKFTAAQLLDPPGRIAPPQAIEARIVGSPIPQEAAEKMTDAQWLTAIYEYDYDDGSSRFERSGELIGGALELASILESQVKNAPVRFANLIERFLDDVNVAYFNAVLSGLSEAEIDNIQVVVQAIQRCHHLSAKPCGRAISWLIGNQAELSWPQEIFEILIWYALNDPDPDQELWRTQVENINSSGLDPEVQKLQLDSSENSSSDPDLLSQDEALSNSSYYGGDIVTAGINTVRGSAATAIAKLIFAEKDRASYFHDSLKEMVNDRLLSVRACVAEALMAMLNYDRDIAVGLFTELCETEEVLLGTQTVKHFLYYILPTHFEVFKPLLQRMINSKIPAVIRVGTQLACIEALNMIEGARQIALDCLSKDEIHRRSASEIFSKNLRSEQCRELCEHALMQLFYDSSKKVRSEASTCFFGFEEDELGQYEHFVHYFIQSPAFFDGLRDLILALEKATDKMPEVIYEICSKLVREKFEGNNLDDRFLGIDTISLSNLLLRAYHQSEDLELQSRLLDVIDLMAERGVYGLDKALEEFEN
jgi:hypothetical protein